MANGGAGPFELNGNNQIIANPDGSLSVNATQRIYNSDGTSTERNAGTFVYHPTHGHIHFDGFAQYQLRERPADNSVGPVVASSRKTSFCLIDVFLRKNGRRGDRENSRPDHRNKNRSHTFHLFV